MVEKSLENLQRKLGYTFSNSELLSLALRHRSLGKNSNERMEFLGDAVLNFIIASELYSSYPKYYEGDLSRLRSNLVKGETLAEIARELELSEYLYMGIGEKKSGGSHRSSILADAIEAIIGAVFLDSDILQCRELILRLFAERLTGLTLEHIKDAKSELQELLQAIKLPLPQYTIVAQEGKAHQQIFFVSCFIPTTDFTAEGNGSSRQKAEQEAAEKILHELKKNAGKL